MWRVAVMALAGCSLFTVHSAATHGVCPGRAAPIVDTAVATVALGVFGFLAIDAVTSQRGGEFVDQLFGAGHATGETNTENAIARPALLIGLPFLASAIYGFVVTGRCS